MAAFPARLGVVAGGGKIPALLLRFCDAHEIQTFVIGFENQTDLELLKGREHVMTRLGAAGQIVKILKNQNINDRRYIIGVSLNNFVVFIFET